MRNIYLVGQKIKYNHWAGTPANARGKKEEEEMKGGKH